MKKTFLILSFLLIIQNIAIGQNQFLIDSLQKELDKSNLSNLEQKNSSNLSDSTAANILYKLSKLYWYNNTDTAIFYANRSLNLSERIGYKKGIGNAYNSLGVINNVKGDYSTALNYHNKSLNLRVAIDDKEGIAWSHNNRGEVFRLLGKYPDALENYYSAAKIFEVIGFKKGIVAAYGNIAIIYNYQGKFSQALKSYETGIEITKELGDKQDLSMLYNNIGITYEMLGDFTNALKNYNLSLKVREEIGDKYGIAYCYFNFGNLLMKQLNYPEALKKHFIALKIREEVQDKYGTSSSYLSIGQIYLKLRKYDLAHKYTNDALTLSQEIDQLDNMRDSHANLVSIDSSMGRYHDALKHFESFIIIRDSLINNENSRKLMQQEMQFDFDKKESLAKAEQENKDAAALAEIGKQKTIRNLILVIIFLLIVSGVFAFNRYRISRIVKEEKMRLKVMVKTQEEERKHMARNLHDDVGVQLSTVKLFISSLNTEKQNHEAESLKRNSIEIINSSINDIRDILVNLSPKSLDAHGYITATEELVNKINQSNALKFILSIHGMEERLEHTTEVALFRITQELINNTIKHAEATEVGLEIILRDDKIFLLYEDNGKGYDIDKQKQGYGITNITTRTALMNGIVHFEAGHKKGTRVHIEIPYSSENSNVLAKI